MDNPTLFDQTYVKGTVEMILFQNNENYYTVLKVDVQESNGDFDDMVTVVGYFPNMVEDETYLFKGSVVQHPKYGKQLKAETFQKEIPQTKDAVIAYLSSDLFKGIGKKTAELIVETIGENAINEILKDNQVIEKVPKLSKKKQEQIVQQIISNQESEQVMIRLNELGFGSKLAMDIYKFYQHETLNVLDQNPYQLVYDIKGVGFQKADQLAQQLGIHPNHPDRLKAGLLFLVEETCIKQGHTYLPQEALINETIQLLSKNEGEDVRYEAIEDIMAQLTEEKKLIEVDHMIAIPSLYYSEIKSTQNLFRVYSHNEALTQFERSDIQLHIGEIEEMNEVHYAASQKEALECAINHKVMLLTGGPGTGKTTVIKGIVQLYSEIHGVSLDYDDYHNNDYPIVLAAPTGRASKRLHESTGLEAMTIHRLIGWNQETKPDDILDNEINAKLIIIDEMSMVDTWLFHQFMAAVPLDAQIIFVGDEDQLPSVGPGQIFKDLIDSNVLPRINLTEVYRQQEGSSIIELAHKMKLGEPVDITQRFHDRSFIPCSTEQIPDVVEKVVNNAVQKGYTMADIQVLAPMYRGNAGIKRLNQILQSILNPVQDKSKREIEFGDVIYRKGDKVLQLINRPNDNIFNGDIGIIVGIFWAKENALNKDVVVVDYDGNEITYMKSDLTELTHAYCTSIHKAQGSEFPIVLMPIVKQYYRMLQKPILYTGLTRAKQSLVFLGDSEAFNMGLATEGKARLTQLYSFLTQYFNNETDENNQGDQDDLPIELTEATMFKINPMINMGEVTPYDFLEIDKA
ncbi:ATP-dependent RecD-like DNA helicase [Staphylococcus coagulans]|uniref:ATP-dependent RecD2 DNA helicase n=1 Tax=Staphylococcus coagulans TaxID=74706 RepID=A0A9X0PDV4_9STAP|nr:MULTISPECIES: ATP-dependent RecD-like DNA helicase [Staphylococcus]NHA35718.1 ATP-dependent RecD-like DNA helicase [Staphylococcus schleiferi]MBA8771648.1 ATP-dependent RecD-like DNA helicase [Staphylococcus coagulans]MBA8775363.1 ATP-dependent RecD-like DNA helicase [Staphylococcus coagulans]MBT2829510.1 ATP-dependent RecD-like DNA helicase [Staphylococcus coagulans]MBT2858985.1 ATP-dependent RecD-like DNA helicase [Staphylococcus coagulans]